MKNPIEINQKQQWNEKKRRKQRRKLIDNE